MKQLLKSKYSWRYHVFDYLRRIKCRYNRNSYLYNTVYNYVDRPEYGYCIWHAAIEAKKLGIDKISIIEFGVATGIGLINIEEHIRRIRKIIDIEFEVYGFDTGTGLPKPVDYRDLPFKWQEGQFTMDLDQLKRKLKNSKMVLGDVKNTCEDFFSKHNPAPIGCVFFDLDLYSSTVDAFKIFSTPPKNYLPRQVLYFDDILGHNEYIGELLAIREFNNSHKDKKIVRPYGLYALRQELWTEKIFQLHDFTHPQYNTLLGRFENDDADGLF